MNQVPVNYGIVNIQSILPNLKGIGKADTKTIEIPYSLPGDKYEVLRFGKRKFFFRWNPKEIQPRVENPHCSHFGECGGCSGQHIPYQEQFELKSRPILEGAHSLGFEKIQALPAEKPYSYRNRMDFAVFPNGTIGLRMSGNFRKVIPISKCEIQSDWANHEMNSLRILFQEFPGIEYDRKTESGFLKYITLRTGVQTDDSMTILTFTEDFLNHENLEKVAEFVKVQSRAKNLVFCFNRKKGEVSANGVSKVIRGKDTLEDTILGKKILIPFDGFYQPNPIEFEKILKYIGNKISEAENFADLFCGSGFFSLIFGEKFQNILGIDIVPSSVDSAKSCLSSEFPNKNLNILRFDLFHKKGVEQMESANLPWEESVVVADPPRSGLNIDLLEFLNSRPAKQIFYVSCNPAKQLADLEILKNSYEMKELLVCDPFPQTPHLESLAYLVPKNR
ncbi:23S rRNA (uracil(1939)-C(5))-methyltransferase RlmD [Leptospira perolatii]|uniref:23S rRNA (Uracil(1939)-C(5))-methyltransferase RlmD n=1 Tax=Leptospira perolatii TaxID=2023191 RepID=A0A2M9ZQ16_9LEPT|nr:23S rRNA (uracil(1939)-C(5))-methyltransferase RlmD [Leptospira perolatii]PJZ68245.1 23S rRNA (uracil(1939)-C(5))-methyltransferase RlmD [Leptospira perolatii]PJZ74170.1 23S rRNA (uracil(1939)-C(5))-methyltransferase RlmD [Leptospira perolatii]